MTLPIVDILDPSFVLAAMEGAVLEDALDQGVAPNPGARRLLQAAERVPLPAGWVAAVGPGPGLRDVRIAAGPGAEAFLMSVGAPAACLGSRIALSSALLADPARAVAALLHELTHLAAGRRDDVVRCWDADVHATLSAEACAACRTLLEPLARVVDLSWGDFLHGVMNASSNMDIRQRIVHPAETEAYLRGVRRGEGPRHGEGLDYTNANLSVNAAVNVAEQGRHARLAAAELLRDVPLVVIGGVRYRVPTLRLRPGSVSGLPVEARRIGGISVMERGWVKSLANSVHVAQDRGSHREGTLGLGHSDPREGTTMGGAKWSCDRKAHEHSRGRDWLHCSEAAYHVGFNNSIESIRAFLAEVGRLVGATFPSLPVAMRLTSCT